MGVVVCVDASKRETHHGGSGLKKLVRRLKAYAKVVSNKEDLSAKVLGSVDVLVLGAPRDKLSTDELEAIRGFVSDGGGLLVMTCEGGETKLGSNVNELLEDFGMLAQDDCVLRAVYYKYLHPKEAYISHGILQPEMVANRKKKSPLEDKGGGLAFVYPRGSTLTVRRPASAVLSSGAISYPMNRCVCAAWEGPKTKQQRPRVVATGSVEMFADDYLEKEDNADLADLIFKWLARDPNTPSLVSPHHTKEQLERQRKQQQQPADDKDHEFQFDLNGETHYADNIKTDVYQRVPDIAALASRLRPCLQEHEELPRDFTKLFNDTLFGFDTKMIPEVVQLYDVLKPATFPPAIRELPNPPLDQFDLDEHFASSRERLAQLANKCLPSGMTKDRAEDDALEIDDLDYYVREAGDIVGVVAHLPTAPTAKRVLASVLQRLVHFKMVNPPQGGSLSEPKQQQQRRMGEEKPDDLSAQDAIASNEPMRRRQQLAHLEPAEPKHNQGAGAPRPTSSRGIGAAAAKAAFMPQPKIGDDSKPQVMSFDDKK
ncbi:hypothetical protein CTAYLR_005508 [Chrysophaeum taylorii]|uniref:Intraflagellar transport protein 52 n=1 Tax=Chrysophaeum taylorii TaxID=2483200 RepID=A0AAD7U4N5_9STRA|nr:hypothetical protein CTAYLR_005508 [Chrysophaeum taylorii]